MNARFITVSGPEDVLAAFEQALASADFPTFPNSPEELEMTWDDNPAIWFRVDGGSQFYKGTLPMAGKSPVLVRSAVRYTPDETANTMRGVGETVSEAVSRLVTSFNPYGSSETTTDSPDVKLHTFKRYSYLPNASESHEQVATSAREWLKANRAKFPGLMIDRAASLKVSGGGTGPITDAPVPDEAIPVPQVDETTYMRQPYFERIGLQPTWSGGQPTFEIHTRARGGGTVIVVVDTAPNSDPNTDGIDWRNVDALIDLRPEQDNPVTVETKSQAQKYHGLMVANLCKVVAPDARVILVRAIDDNGHGSVDAIIRIINYLVRHVPGNLTYSQLGADGLENSDAAFIPTDAKLIFNMSLEASTSGGEAIDIPNLLAVIDDAVLKGALFVCASGNGSSSGISRNQSEPAAYGFYAGYSSKEYSQMAGFGGKPVSEGKYAYPSGFSSEALSQAENGSSNTDPTGQGFRLEPYNMVIGVASTSKFSRLLYASFSNEGPIAAPAVEILLDAGTALTLPDVDWVQVGDKTLLAYDANGHYILKDTTSAPSRYVCWSGTSFATPLVAGQAALLIGARLDSALSLSSHQVKAHIWQTAYNADYWNRPKEINVAASLDTPAQVPAEASAV